MNLAIALLFSNVQGNSVPSTTTGRLLVSVLSSPLTSTERERITRERDRATKRDDGSPLFTIEREGFLIVIERRLLPDDATAVRSATLDRLTQEWTKGGSISPGGPSGRAYARGIVSQLQPEFRRDVKASGAFLVTRSAQMVLQGGGRRDVSTLSEHPNLNDDLYPSGGSEAPSKPAIEASGEIEEIAPPPAGRVAELLGSAGPATQARSFDVAFRFIAERWRQDEAMLHEKYARLDEALDEDLAGRNPYGLPKAGTAFTDLDPKLQAHLKTEYGDNWKVFGFGSREEAVGWITDAKVESSMTRDYCAFGRWDGGRGGVYSQIRLFTP